MKRLRPLLTGVLLLLTWVAAQAQHSTTSVYLEETLEELSLYGEEADWEDELEQLEQLLAWNVKLETPAQIRTAQPS